MQAQCQLEKNGKDARDLGQGQLGCRTKIGGAPAAEKELKEPILQMLIFHVIQEALHAQNARATQLAARRLECGRKRERSEAMYITSLRSCDVVVGVARAESACAPYQQPSSKRISRGRALVCLEEA